MKIAVKNLGIIFIIYFFVCYELFQNSIPFFSYWDEMLVILFFVALMVKKRNAFIKDIGRIYVCFIVVMFSGFISTFINNYQPIMAVIEDVLVNGKFLAAFGLAYLLVDGEELERYHKTIIFHIKLIVGVLFVLVVTNRFTTLFPMYENWNGIFMGNMLFFSHPTFFAGCIISLTCLSVWMTKYTKMTVQFLMLGYMIVDTMRSKAIAWVAVAIVVYWFVLLRNRKVSIPKLVTIAGTCIFFAWEDIVFHFVQLAGKSARSVLIITGVKLMQDYFPFGAGFGTFGSNASAEYYSPVYSLYGIDTVQGLGGLNKRFISDSFWPMIMGQFGIVGFIAYLMILVFLFIMIQRFYRIDKRIYTSLLLTYIYLCISSIGEPTFVNSLCVPYAFLLGYGAKVLYRICAENK